MIKKYFFALALILTTCLAFAAPAANAYDPFNSTTLCSNGTNSKSAVCSDTTKSNPLTGPNGVIVKATNIVGIVAGAAAVILLIISGLKYITANGDSNAISNARTTITYTLIGLAVIVSSVTIVNFVISKIAGDQ